jgi:prepilin-type N-terminal cleavage/methylation domain-containing protein
MKTNRFRSFRRGFTLVEILIVVAIVGILVGLAVPNFLKSRTQARKQLCIENLSQIESAKQLWGLENSKKDGDTPADQELIGADRYIKITPECAAGGVYRFNAIGTTATCTIEGHSY